MVTVQDHQIFKAKACKIMGFSRSAFHKSKVGCAAKVGVLEVLLQTSPLRLFVEPQTSAKNV